MSLDVKTFERTNRTSRMQEDADHENEIRGALHAGLSASQNPSQRMTGAISAAVANRTHRVVRERANILRARRNKVRSLWIPLAVCASLLIAVCFAVWNILDQYEITPSGVPDSSQQLLVLMMWSLPLSAALLALAWYKRGGSQNEDESRSAR